MKKTIGTMALIAVFALLFAIPALAQNPPTYVEGGVRIDGLMTFGDPLIGNWSYLNGGAGFKILPSDGCGPNSAEGKAGAKGLLKTGGEIGNDFLLLNSLSRVGSGAEQLQGRLGEIYVDGLAQRANWGTLKIGDNFISGYDSSMAEYYARIAGPSPSADGNALTGGKMELQLTPTTSSGKITDQAKASVRSTFGEIDPSVQGSAGLASGNYLNQPGVDALAQTDAKAGYEVSDPRRVSGGLEITSNTNITQTPEGISLSANTKASATTTTGGPILH